MSVLFRRASAACLFLTPAIAFSAIKSGPGNEAKASFDGSSNTNSGFELVQFTAEKDTQSSVPPLRVQAMVGTQQRRLAGGTSYRKQMDINPKMVIEGAIKARAIPELEAVMIIVTMDTRAKYVNRREVYRVESAQTIQIPAATDGSRREFPFESSSVNFDSWRDHTNLGGATYKYYVFGLRDPQTKAIIDFQTNNPQLASLAKVKPERREDFLSLTKGAEFPNTIK